MERGKVLEFNHFSVMLDECINGLSIKEGGIYVDCTLGGGGHSHEILKALNGKGRLIGIDQDMDALNYCREKFKEYSNITFVHDNFRNIKQILHNLNIPKIDGILMDLGVSSYQIDTDERGFSYIRNGPLDMRMDRSCTLTAHEIVNFYSEDKLNYIFKTYGEETYYRKVSRGIIKAREEREILTTHDLVSIIDGVIPKHEIKKRGHLSKKVFQALRIEVNDELHIIEGTIKDAVNSLNLGGRICIITFHSLEDRIVKQTFNYLSLDCVCPKDFPICKCDKEKEISLINKKPILPTAKEISLNSRSSSAKLRIGEKVI